MGHMYRGYGQHQPTLFQRARLAVQKRASVFAAHARVSVTVVQESVVGPELVWNEKSNVSGRCGGRRPHKRYGTHDAC